MKIKMTLVLMVLLNLWGLRAQNGNMRNMTSMEIVADMKTGWNLGNTLDAETQDETGWGNPRTTKAMIDKIAQRGFKTMRLPVTWRFHMGGAPNYTIEAAWLDRVEEVANYALKNNMYVIINIHHDDTWIIPTYAKAGSVKDQLAKVWTQIANRFKNYDDYVIFETLNEPRHENSPEEWSGGTDEGRDVVNQYQKACVDAIRATGGNNELRHLMVSSYAASATDKAMDGLVIPNNDPRVIVSIHNYTPFDFALGKRTNWGSAADKADMDRSFDKIYNKFVAKGRAVVMGEWCGTNNNNLSDRVAHAEYYAKNCVTRKMCPIWWDIGAQDGSGLLNRNNLTWFFPTIADAVIKATGNNTPPPSAECNSIATTIQAEDYKDMSGIQTESTTDTGGGQNVGYIDNGDWMDYCIKIPSNGNYKLQLRIAALSNSGKVQILINGSVKTTINIPETGGWQNWKTITTALFNANSGDKTLRVRATGSGFNLNWFKVNTSGTNNGGGVSSPVSSAAPIGKTIWLKANVNGRFVSADITNSSRPLEADRTVVGAWEKFNVIDAGSGKIALKALANNKYVSASNLSADKPLAADSNIIGNSQKFLWVDAGNGNIALKAEINGKYVSADITNTDRPLEADRTEIGDWEKFTWGETSTAKFVNKHSGSSTDLKVYPNPSNGTVSVNYNEPLYSIRIYNLKGSEVKLIKNISGNQTLDLSELSSGVYILKTEGKIGYESKKLIIE